MPKQIVDKKLAKELGAWLSQPCARIRARSDNKPSVRAYLPLIADGEAVRMSSRRGTETRRLPGQILVRLTAEQQTIVAMRAEADQVSIATWIRLLLAKTIRVSPGPVSIRARPPELILEIAHLRSVLAELSDHLGNTALGLSTRGQASNHMAIEELLSSIKERITALDEVKEKLWRPAA